MVLLLFFVGFVNFLFELYFELRPSSGPVVNLATWTDNVGIMICIDNEISSSGEALAYMSIQLFVWNL